jgi:D-alanine transaminase
MSRIAYVNGIYAPHREAAVHIEDRGYQFADGVYEVCEVRDGRLVDETRHLDRLARSLSELRMAWPVSRPALCVILREVVARNRVRDGLVYFQVTRGVARRDFMFPAHQRSSLVVTARSADRAALDTAAGQGIAVVTRPDNRWERVDIKTVGLLPNVLAKQAAKEAGAKEAWFVDANGYVTEGGSSNAWIIVGNTIQTRPAETGILRGVTRTTLLDLLAREGLKLKERPFKVGEALKADEAFITSATTIVTPVVKIDGKPVGSGKPGPVALKLRKAFHNIAELA